MLKRPLITNVVPVADIAGDNTYNYELSVNPLSTLLLRLDVLNDTGTLADYHDYMSLAAGILRVNLLYRGQSIISMSGADIAAHNYLRWGILPEETNTARTNNDRRQIVLPIHLGRGPWDWESCFPSTRRGELTLQVQLDDAITGYDDMDFGVDSIELLGAEPKEFERRLTLSRTSGATGNNDMDLVPGRVIRDILLFGTTGPNALTSFSTVSWRNIRLLVDNQEAVFSGVDWETLKALPYIHGRQRSMSRHHHGTTTDGNAQTSVTTLGYPFGADAAMNGYAIMDFDVTRDDKFSLDTKDAKKVVIRYNAGTADAVRAVQSEVIPVSSLGA